MYTKTAVRNYAKGVKPAKKTYRKNTAGTVLASVAIGQAVDYLKRDWKKGKKSKLSKLLNPGGRWDKKSKLIGKKKWYILDKDGNVLGGPYFTKQQAKDESYGMGKVKIVDKSTASNPSAEPISPEVEDLSKEWHGRENQDVTDVEEVETFETDLVDLGDLEELGIWGANGDLFTISFKKDRPTLACDGSGHNLEVIGGDQELDLKGEGIQVKGKNLIPLGYIYSIVYETDKHHLEGSSGYPEPYEHYFAEDFYKGFIDPDEYKDTGKWFKDLIHDGVPQQAIKENRLPVGMYDKGNGKILIAGGAYEVTELGIKD